MATEEEIRRLAYAIWEKEGSPEGRADEYWYRAKRLLEDQGKGGAHMLSISDWISFLTSEKNSNIGNIISLTTVIIAAVALIMSVANNNWGGAVGSALICVTLMVVYDKTASQYQQHAKEAGRLLNDIMRGEERDLSKIEKRWKEIPEKGKKKK